MLITFIFFGLILLLFTVFLQVYVITVISEVYKRKEKIIPKVLYLTFIKYSLIVASFFILSWLISAKIYSLLYIIYFTYLGLLINSSMICALYQFILKFKQISSFNSKIITLLIPIMITVYSLIKAQILYFKEETLINEGYKDSITIMHISDMHLGAIYQKNSVENLVDIINKKNPDVVVITGDISDGSLKVEKDWIMPFNKVEDNIEVLYITGNHENLYGKEDIIEDIKKVKKIKYLGNSDEIVKIKGINFIGIDYEYHDVKTRTKEIIEKNKIKDDINILLYHIPKISLKDLKEVNIFLMLAGHTHGGQIFPFTILAWLGNKYFTGLYSNNKNNYVFVSSGYGTALTPMRFLSEKMIGIINIKGNK